MSTTRIGVHLADHTFYPIMDDRAPGRKRVILSTSHPDQECVDIVLYRQRDGYAAEEERLGHVMLCDIAPGTPEESEIELTVHLEADGALEVTAVDRRSGNRRDVSIDRDGEIPGYEEDDAFTAGQVRDLLDDDLPQRKRRTGIAGFVVALLVLLLLLGLVWWFFFADSPGGEDATGTAGSSEEEVTAGDTPATDDTPGAESAPAVDDTPATDDQDPATDNAIADDQTPAAGDTTASDTTTPDTPSPEQYEIKWGDTLWDISSMFYGTPRRFPEIADENKIPNPDLIFADDEIRIPRR
ncbi:MAG: LysM peptidoglycan-binding domain-containing protein [Alkalispirochaeta sp.]